MSDVIGETGPQEAANLALRFDEAIEQTVTPVYQRLRRWDTTGRQRSTRWSQARACVVRRSPSWPESRPTTTPAWNRAGASPRRLAVVEAVGRALGLDDAGRAHLHDLIGITAAPVRRRARGVQRVRPGLYQLIDALDGEPALVLGRRTDVLAANQMAKALFTDFERLPPRHRNYARWMFLDDDARSLFADWEVQARAAVESLRLDAGRDPDDQATAALIADLREHSREFAHWWDQHRVHQRTHGSKRLRHPLVGELTVEYETLSLPGDPDMTLFVYTAEAGSSSKRALDLLASWTLPGPGGDAISPRDRRGDGRRVVNDADPA